MRRKRPVRYQTKSPTPEQLAAISLLWTKIDLLGKQLNRPWSAFVSIFIAYPILNFLFVQNISPLYSIFNEIFNHYTVLFFNHDAHTLPGGEAIDRYRLTVTLTSIIENLERISENVLSQVLPHYTHQEGAENILRNIDALHLDSQFARNYPRLSIEFERSLSLLTCLKQSIQGNTSMEECAIGSTHSSNFTALFEAVKPLYTHLELAQEKSYTALSYLILFSYLCGTILIQYCVTDIILSYCYPGGVWQKQPPRRTFPLTEREARKLIQTLKPIKQSLTQKSKCCTVFARYLTLPLLMLTIQMLRTDDSPPLDLAVFSFTCLLIAIINVKTGIKTYYAKQSFEQRLKEEQENIMAFTEGFEVACKINRKKTLTFSFFDIQFQSKKYDSETISGKKIARIFKNICIEQNINLLYQNKNHIAISAQTNFNASKIASIKIALEKSIKNELDSRKTQEPPLPEADPSNLASLFYYDNTTTGAGKFTPQERKDKRRHNSGAGAGAGADKNTSRDKGTAEHRIIHWGSKIYDSRKTSCSIFPILGRKQDKQALNNAHFFVTSQIDWSRVPTDMAANLKAKLTEQLEAPKLVRKKGVQGFVLWNNQERDQNARWFQAAVKLKFKGVHGDVRAYAEAEKSDDGSTLFILKGLKLKAH